MKKAFLMPLFTTLLSLFAVEATRAQQQDEILGFWFNDKKDAKIQIYKMSDGSFAGRIVWLKEPTKDGKPKVDENNPKKTLQTQPLTGLVILRNLKKDGESYDDGTIYDPQNGKTYDCKMTCKGRSLFIRGYIGISLIGRTTTWQKAG